MKRIRTSAWLLSDAFGDTNRNRATAAIRDFRQRDPQLAVDDGGARVRETERVGDADDPCETPVAAFDQVKAWLSVHPPPPVLARNQHRAPLDEQPAPRRPHAGDVDDDLQRVVGFVDVDRRRTLAGQRFRTEDPSELEEYLADLIGELADLVGQGDGQDAGPHGPHHPMETRFKANPTI